MSRKMLKVLLPLFVALLVQSIASGQDNTAKKHPQQRKPVTHSASEAQKQEAAQKQAAEDVNALREQVVAQQKMLQQLQDSLEKRDKMLEDIQVKLSNIESGTTHAEQQNTQAVQSLQTAVAEQQTVNTSLTTEIQDQQKKTHELSDLQSKVKIGAVFFGDYGFYSHTGFGPQFITQMNQTGPFNPGFNSFDVTRAYINMVFNPNGLVSLRITPNVYRQITGSVAGDNAGNSKQNGLFGYASSSDGNLTYRLKYAYVDFNRLFTNSTHFSKDKLTAGQMMQPLTDWEEQLDNYRYVYLTAWNYLTLSSTYVGVKLHGPIEFKGKEYLDYDFGTFNTASFHAIEFSDKKQGMARFTYYPFGTKIDRHGLALTAFENYGYADKTPDTRSEVINRFAAVVSYQHPKDRYEIAGEFDLGHNAMSSGNFFSGAGPQDAFSTLSTPTVYAPFNTLAGKVLNGAHSRQKGVETFGYYRFAEDSPWRVFGYYSYWLSNTNYGFKNPFDYERIVGGFSYAVNKNLEIALQSSNFHYLHGYNSTELTNLNNFAGLTGTGSNAPLTSTTMGASRGDTNGTFINMVYSF